MVVPPDTAAHAARCDANRTRQLQLLRQDTPSIPDAEYDRLSRIAIVGMQYPELSRRATLPPVASARTARWRSNKSRMRLRCCRSQCIDEAEVEAFDRRVREALETDGPIRYRWSRIRRLGDQPDLPDGLFRWVVATPATGIPAKTNDKLRTVRAIPLRLAAQNRRVCSRSAARW